MDTYSEIHMSNKYGKKHNLNVWLDWEFEPGTHASLIRCSAIELSRSINIHGPSRPNYHISLLTKFLSFKKHTSSCQDLINQCLIKDVTEMRGNIEITTFYIEEGKSVNVFEKY